MSGRRSNEAAKIAVGLGFQDVYNLEGGLTAWTGPTQLFMNNHSPWVHTLFEAETETAQYVITDLGNTNRICRMINIEAYIEVLFTVETREAYIVDPVLDYDPFASAVRPTMANSLLRFIEQHELNVTKIIDTHVHAVSLDMENLFFFFVNNLTLFFSPPPSFLYL